MNQFKDILFKSISGVRISLFRFLFGLVIFWEMGRLVLWDNIIHYQYINTVFNFKYPNFSWIEIAPDGAMYAIVWSTLIFSLLFAIGVLHRVITPILFLLYTYLVLIDSSYWNNHYYFYSLILFLFIFIPPAINGLRGLKLRTINYQWQVYILQFMVIVVLFFGGISKLSNAGWIDGSACDALILNEVNRKGIEMSSSWHDISSFLMTWGGLFFDLTAGFLLLYRRTFWWILPVFILFNLSNSYVFSIGSFPFAMLGTLALFLPKSIYQRLKFENQTEEKLITPLNRKLTLMCLGVFISIQLLLPFRHFLIKGNVFWTCEGKLCAWHMMSGAVSLHADNFYVVAKAPNSENKELINVELAKYLNKNQIRNLSKFPNSAPQFARFIEYEMTIDGYTEIEVYSEIFVGRNGKLLKPIVDPNQNLLEVETSYWSHNNWILLYLDEGF